MYSTVKNRSFNINESFVILTINKAGELTDYYYVPRFYAEHSYNEPVMKQVGDKIYSVYIDYEKNLDNEPYGFDGYSIPLQARLSKPKPAIAVAYIEDGVLKRDQFDLEYNSKEIIIQPHLTRHVDDQTIDIVVQDGLRSMSKNDGFVVTLKLK